ncbi:MAG TPA: tetratricopeptide repeat protein [Leptolyngbyaceae cyanobacterium]
MLNLVKKAAQCLVQDEYDEAIAIYEQAIEADPTIISNYGKLGLALLLAGREEEAQACWLSVLLEGVEDESAELIEILEKEGIQRLEAGKYEQAEKIYCQIIELAPNYAIAYKNLGNALLNQGKLEDAIAYYQQGLALAPNDAITYYHLGIVFHQQDKIQEAIDCYQKSLAISPDSATVFNNLGNAWQRKGKLEEAIACYQQSLILDSNQILTYHNLGSALNAQGKVDEALATFQKALALDPNYVESYHNLAIFYQDNRQYNEALACCDRALEIEPNNAEIHWNRALNLLKLGVYEQGFIEYEWRWQRKNNHPRTLPKPIWNGSDLTGKTILLQAEQGMGDIIQFIRYIPLLLEQASKIIVECHPPLVKLLKTMKGIYKVVAIGEELPEFDVYIPILSLPRILKTNLETIPAQIPYLTPLESVSVQLDKLAKSDFKVGIVWAGNPEHPSDRRRSSSLHYFIQLLDLPNIAFYSLQKGLKASEISQISSSLPLIDLSNQINNFADTAAVITQMDLVITVDTAVAHLAGALGKPVWVLLCYNSDWRWIIDRDDTPWYPTMRLFHQNNPGDWQEVLERVRQSLTEFT